MGSNEAPLQARLPLWAVLAAAGSLVVGVACGQHPDFCEVSARTEAVPAETAAAAASTIPGANEPPCDQTVQRIIVRQSLEGRDTINLPESVNAVRN